MDKRFLPFVAVLLTGICAFFSSCHSCQRQGETDEERFDTFRYEHAIYEASETLNTSSVQQRIYVDYPQKSDSTVLADSLRAWIADKVATHYAPVFGDSDAVITYTGDLRDADTLIQTVGKIGVTYMKDELKEADGEGFETQYNNDFSVEYLCQTARYITFETKYEIFTGGAHGLWIYSGHTFRKSDGAEMGWRLLDMTKKQQIIDLFREGIREYLSEGADGEQLTDSALYANLMLWDDPDTPENELEYGLPLPGTPPWLTDEGLAFIYQQYEITAYALGLPCATIPIDKIAPLLSEEGRELLGIKK